MKKDKIKEIMDKKPDLETESFRAWIPQEDKKGKKELKKAFEGSETKVKYKDFEVNLTGFSTAHKKKGGELMLAYKFKHKDKMFLYYESKNLKGKEKEGFDEIKKFISLKGYEIKSIMEFIKNIYNERKTLDKLAKMKKEKKK